MKASETNLEDLLEGKKQYLVPLYQRTYLWTQSNLQRLWEDLTLLAISRSTNPASTHFLGSIVFAPTPDPGPTGVKQYVVVDGQQHLTTLTLLLAAVRDHRAKTEASSHFDRINEDYLVVKWSEGQPTKLLPTQADRDSYLACIRGTVQGVVVDPIGAAYSYFREQLRKADGPEESSDIEKLEDAVLRGLALVSITSESGDNVHRMFESLNNTGLQLSQADLLRNYLFMRLPTRGEIVYRDVWLPLQTKLSLDELVLLFWIDLVHTRPVAQQTEVYKLQQERLDTLHSEAEIEGEARRFLALGNLLYLALHPEGEVDAAVCHELTRLAQWGSATAYPLIVNLLQRRAAGDADSAQIANALRYLLSFFVRRMLIGQATKNVNRILLGAVPAIAGSTAVDTALRLYFSTGRKAWATDEQIREAARIANLYWSGRAQQKKLLLLWIEETFDNHEPVDPVRLSIEHVAPQSMTDWWRTHFAAKLQFDEEAEVVYHRVLHTLGNLTLTGYNSELSNRSFAEKRKLLQNSGLKMNQEIARHEQWGRDEILERAAKLSELIIALWPGPDPDATDPETGLDNTMWTRLAEILLIVPAGTWTSYGDLAALVGTHHMLLSERLATRPVANAHRVLREDGTISPIFRWSDPSCRDDPSEILKAEGVQFDELGRAKSTHRLALDELAHLLGLDSTDIIGALQDPEPGNGEDVRDKFIGQVKARQNASTAHGVLALLNSWAKMGGYLEYGSAAETSCFLIARNSSHESGSIWPIVIYPSGKAEVVFQHMASRPPFDDIQMRKEFMARLNAAGEINLSEARLELRPGFPLEVLASDSARAIVEGALQWFLAQSLSQSNLLF